MLAEYLDGQKEAPQGVRESAEIRQTLGRALEVLKVEHQALTMADLQALLWYREKRLHDTAKAKLGPDGGGTTESYDHVDTPDYANAAALARSKGIDPRSIDGSRGRQAGDRGNGSAAAGRAGAVQRTDRGRRGEAQQSVGDARFQRRGPGATENAAWEAYEKAAPKAKRWLQRNFTSKGLLNDSMREARIRTEGERNAVELDVSFYNRAFERALALGGELDLLGHPGGGASLGRLGHLLDPPEQRRIGPWGIGDEMLEALVGSADVLRLDRRGDRLDALALQSQRQAGAVGIERRSPRVSCSSSR